MSLESILILTGVAVVLLAGSRLGFGNRRLPAILAPLANTGAVFILVGAVIGPSGTNLFSVGFLAQFNPLFVIGLGWIGFLYGSHLEWRLLRRYPVGLYGAALLEATITFAVVALSSWWILSRWMGLNPMAVDTQLAALMLGICASGTAPAGIFQISSRHVAHHELNIIRFFAAVDDLPALFLLGAMDAFFHPASLVGPWWVPIGWLLFSIALGIGGGIVTHWVFPKEEDFRHNDLVLLGMISLLAGAAEYFHLSPLLVTALAGATFANISPRKESAYGLLAQREHILYAIFLLMAGILLRLDWSHIYLLVPGFILLRGFGKITGGLTGWFLLLDRKNLHPMIGSGLLFQGGMTLAMAVNFEQIHGNPLAPQVATTVVVAVVVNDWLGPVVANRALRKRRRA